MALITMHKNAADQIRTLIRITNSVRLCLQQAWSTDLNETLTSIKYLPICRLFPNI